MTDEKKKEASRKRAMRKVVLKDRTELIERIHAAAKRLRYRDSDWRRLLKIEFGKKHLNELELWQLDWVADHLEQCVRQQK